MVFKFGYSKQLQWTLALSSMGTRMRKYLQGQALEENHGARRKGEISVPRAPSSERMLSSQTFSEFQLQGPGQLSLPRRLVWVCSCSLRESVSQLGSEFPRGLTGRVSNDTSARPQEGELDRFSDC